MGIINTFETTLNGINGATWINNVKIDGAQSISINNGKVYVDGKLRKDLSEPSIEIKIEGTVNSIRTGSGNDLLHRRYSRQCERNRCFCPTLCLSINYDKRKVRRKTSGKTIIR